MWYWCTVLIFPSFFPFLPRSLWLPVNYRAVFPIFEATDTALWLIWKSKDTMSYTANSPTNLHFFSILQGGKISVQSFFLCTWHKVKGWVAIFSSCALFSQLKQGYIWRWGLSQPSALTLPPGVAPSVLSLLPTSSFLSQTTLCSGWDTPSPLLAPVLLWLHGKVEWLKSLCLSAGWVLCAEPAPGALREGLKPSSSGALSPGRRRRRWGRIRSSHFSCSQLATDLAVSRLYMSNKIT